MALSPATQVPARSAPGSLEDEVADRYLDLMKSCLTRYLFIDEEPHTLRLGWTESIGLLKRVLGPRGVRMVKHLAKPVVVGSSNGEPQAARLPAAARRTGSGSRVQLVKFGGRRAHREVGCDWPPFAETMVGLRRLENVQQCVRDVIRQQVPGDILEAGVWRGGTAIFMRAVLAAHGDASRRVWVADSFQGLPMPDAEKYPEDAERDLWIYPELAVGLEAVKANFARYGLLDDRVEFLPGWFKDTLPSAPIERLAVLRLDGDLYESTMDALSALYPKVSPGGYVIVDDYGCLEACKRAVDDYRAAHGITDEIREVDWTGAYWQRTS